MGYTEMWGAIGSRFAECGVVDGCLPYKNAAGNLAISKGVVRLKIAIGNYHVRSVDFVMGDLVANTDAEVSLAAAADGFYHVYAHPTLDADKMANGFELRLGGIILDAEGGDAVADMDAALLGYEPGAEVAGKDIPVCPEPNYDASKFKMVAAAPDQDFYQGRSLYLCTIEVKTNAVNAISVAKAHRVR